MMKNETAWMEWKYNGKAKWAKRVGEQVRTHRMLSRQSSTNDKEKSLRTVVWLTTKKWTKVSVKQLTPIAKCGVLFISNIEFKIIALKSIAITAFDGAVAVVATKFVQWNMNRKHGIRSGFGSIPLH